MHNTPPLSLAEHVDFLLWVIGVALGVLAFFLVRTLNKIDADNKEQFQIIGEHERQLSWLMGQHEANHGVRAPDHRPLYQRGK